MLEKDLTKDVNELHEKHMDDLKTQIYELDNRLHAIKEYEQSSKKIKDQATFSL
jgi:uncharacterized membrane protein